MKNIHFSSKEELLNFIENDQEDKDLNFIGLSLKYRKSEENQEIPEGSFTINSELTYKIEKSEKGYKIHYGSPNLKSERDVKPEIQYHKVDLKSVIEDLSKTLGAIQNIEDSQKVDSYGSDFEHSDVVKENVNKQIEAAKELNEILIKQQDFIDKEKLVSLSNQYNIIYKTKDNDIYKLNLKFAEDIKEILTNLVNKKTEENQPFLQGPSLKSTKTSDFEKVISTLFTDPSIKLKWNENPYAILMGELDLLHLIKKVNFRDLELVDQDNQDKHLNTILNWLKVSDFDNSNTNPTLEMHEKNLKTKCPPQLNKAEFFFLSLYTKFTPTEDEFAFCSILNRAIMAQDTKSLEKLNRIMGTLKDDEAKSAALALMVAGSALIGTALSKLNKDSQNRITFRDTFLDIDSYNSLEESLKSGKPVQMGQFLSSSAKDKGHQSPSAFNNKTGEQAQIVFLLPFGGDLSTFSYYDNESEFLLSDMPLQVLGITSHAQYGHRIFVKPVWGIGSENKPPQHKTYEPLKKLFSKIIENASNPEQLKTELNSLTEIEKGDLLVTKFKHLEGNTLLHVAAKNPELLKIIFHHYKPEQVLDALIVNNKGYRTPLDIVAESEESINTILEYFKPEMLTIQNSKGDTLLHEAVQNPELLVPFPFNSAR